MPRRHAPIETGLDVERLTVRYGAIVALNNLNLFVHGSEHMAVIGPSGSGKTTLLRCIAGFIRPTSGRILWNEEKWNATDGSAIAPEHRRIGMITQNPALWPHMTAEQHLHFVLKWRNVPARDRAAEVDNMLRMVKLRKRATHRPSELSGGEAQRLALARALCGGSRLLLLDEPLGQLDVPLRRELAKEIREVARESGATVLHITHDPADAIGVADRIAVIERGTLTRVATADELRDRPGSAFVEAAFRWPTPAAMPEAEEVGEASPQPPLPDFTVADRLASGIDPTAESAIDLLLRPDVPLKDLILAKSAYKTMRSIAESPEDERVGGMLYAGCIAAAIATHHVRISSHSPDVLARELEAMQSNHEVPEPLRHLARRALDTMAEKTIKLHDGVAEDPRPDRRMEQ